MLVTRSCGMSRRSNNATIRANILPCSARLCVCMTCSPGRSVTPMKRREPSAGNDASIRSNGTRVSTSGARAGRCAAGEVPLAPAAAPLAATATPLALLAPPACRHASPTAALSESVLSATRRKRRIDVRRQAGRYSFTVTMVTRRFSGAVGTRRFSGSDEPLPTEDSRSGAMPSWLVR